MAFRIPHSRVPPGCRTQQAFTLLEVVLALAILAVSLAALGEVLRVGEDNSREARDLTQAQLIAASKLAELTSGALLLEAVVDAPVAEIVTEPRWFYSIETAQTQELNLLAVRVTVRQDLPANLDPVSYSVVRWMPDPLATAAATGTSTAAGGTSSGSTAGAAQ